MRLLLIAALFVISVGAAVAIPSACGADTADLPVTQTVTRDFGTELIAEAAFDEAPEAATVMSLLQAELAVETRDGGGYVETIEGFAGGARADWFFYVNGIESDVAAASRALSAGDKVWWDLHDYDAVARIPAVVGSFPEPFRSGLGGKRLPVRLDCQTSDRICDEVTERLAAAGVTTIARSTIQREVGPDLLRLVVGPWEDIRIDTAARVLESEPSASGVYARFLGEDRLALYGETGEALTTVGDGAGLVAAVRADGQQPTWVVTGTDEVGVAAAAAMLEEELLDQRFAVAVEDGERVALPLQLPTSD